MSTCTTGKITFYCPSLHLAKFIWRQCFCISSGHYLQRLRVHLSDDVVKYGLCRTLGQARIVDWSAWNYYAMVLNGYPPHDICEKKTWGFKCLCILNKCDYILADRAFVVAKEIFLHSNKQLYLKNVSHLKLRDTDSFTSLTKSALSSQQTRFLLLRTLIFRIILFYKLIRRRLSFPLHNEHPAWLTLTYELEFDV